jgi:hypothetical protein
VGVGVGVVGVGVGVVGVGVGVVGVGDGDGDGFFECDGDGDGLLERVGLGDGDVGGTGITLVGPGIGPSWPGNGPGAGRPLCFFWTAGTLAQVLAGADVGLVVAVAAVVLEPIADADVSSWNVTPPTTRTTSAAEAAIALGRLLRPGACTGKPSSSSLPARRTTLRR